MAGLRPGYGVPLESARRLLGLHTPAAVVDADWPAGKVRISAYLGVAELPTEIPGRVRCLVTDEMRILVTWDVSGTPDCFPGGGAEPGESIAETARREVWEETGWHIDIGTIEVLGWIHLESFVEPSSDHRFPHPDSFMTVIRVRPAHAEANQEDWRDVDGFIARSAFLPVSALPEPIKCDPISCAFLDRALGTVWRTGR